MSVSHLKLTHFSIQYTSTLYCCDYDYVTIPWDVLNAEIQKCQAMSNFATVPKAEKIKHETRNSA